MIGLMASLVLGWVGVSSERGDTAIRMVTAKEIKYSGSWTLDGTKVTVVSRGGDPVSYALSATDSILPTPGLERSPVFLKLGTTPGVYPPVIVHVPDDTVWWRVKGKTGSWALELDSSYAWCTIGGPMSDYFVYLNGTRFRWARIHDGQPWVRWIDTLRNPASGFGRTAATWKEVWRGLNGAAGSFDSLWGEVRPYHSLGDIDTSIHFRADIALASSDTGHPLCARSISDRGTTTASGEMRNAVLGSSENLRAKTSFSWWTSNPLFNDSTYNPQGTTWKTVSVVWKYRIGTVTDSVVSLGEVPDYLAYDPSKGTIDPAALAPRSPLRPGLRSLAVDPRGRRIPSNRRSGNLHDLLRRGEGFDLTAH